MRRRKKNGFVTLQDELENMSRKQSSQNKKSSRHQKPPPQLNGKSKRNVASSRKSEDESFRRQLEHDGTMSINEMASDGNCLFRSLSDQLYHDYGNNHEEIRQDVCDYIELMEDEFSVFLVLDENEEDEDAANFEEYVQTMRSEGEWGGNLELVAAARLYRRDVQVFSIAAAYTIDHGNKISGGPKLTVSYHDNDHYNSVRHSHGKTPPPLVKFMPKRQATTSQSPTDEVSMGESLKTTESVQTATTDEESNSEMAKKCKKSSNGLSENCSSRGSMTCPCGSKRKYRECCRKKEKSSSKSFAPSKVKETKKNKTKTSKNNHSSKTTVPTESKDEASEIAGVFRILKI